MKFSAPKMATWWVAVVIGVLGILDHFVPLPLIGGLSAYLVVIGFVILAVATIVDGL
jgi:hypothetical protein